MNKMLPVKDIQQLIKNIKQIDRISTTTPDSSLTYYDAVPKDSYYLQNYFRESCVDENPYRCSGWKVSTHYIKQFAQSFEQFLNKHNEIPESGIETYCFTPVKLGENTHSTSNTENSQTCRDKYYFIKFEINPFLNYEDGLAISFIKTIKSDHYTSMNGLYFVNH